MRDNIVAQELYYYPIGTPSCELLDAGRALSLSKKKVVRTNHNIYIKKGINLGLKLVVKTANKHPEIKDFRLIAEYVRRKYNAGK